MTTATYNWYIKTPAWQAKRIERLDIDHHACQACSSPENLHVHHLEYGNLGDEPMTDLLTLCEDCHRLVHRAHRARKGSLAMATRRTVAMIRKASGQLPIRSSKPAWGEIGRHDGNWLRKRP